MNKPLDESRCCKRVWREWDSVQCDRAGKYEHEGKKYCKQHHPETIAAAKKAKTDKFKEHFKRGEKAAEIQRKRFLVIDLAKEWYRSQEIESSEPLTRLSAAVESLIASEKEG
jgi:deoxyribodipyrimidine photolyase